jgi:DNA-binding CsgD family transcriptional regulator
MERHERTNFSPAIAGEPVRAAFDGGCLTSDAGVLVLALLAEGASNKATARRLGISVHTAKFHVRQVIDKLDASGRTDAVAHAAAGGVPPARQVMATLPNPAQRPRTAPARVPGLR